MTAAVLLHSLIPCTELVSDFIPFSFLFNESYDTTVLINIESGNEGFAFRMLK